MDNDDLLTSIGKALWGSRWQTDMAEELGVSDRTVRRWAAKAEAPRSGVWLDLMRICQERALLLDKLTEDLKLAAAPRCDDEAP